MPCYGDARHARRHAADVPLRLRSGDAARRRHCRSSSCSRSTGRSASARTTSCRCRCCTAARRSRLPHRLVRLPDRLQPHPRRVVAAARRACDVLVLDALRDRPHPTHFSLAEAIAAARAASRRGATYFTHMCHDLPHAATCARLPAGVELAYDGLVLDVRAIASLSMEVIHFPDDPRPPRWHQPGAGARQLRRPAPRPPEDPRPRAPRRRRARRHAGRR